jgi:hypothetical protein
MNKLKSYNLLHLVALLFETLRYKPDSRGFDSSGVTEIFL